MSLAMVKLFGAGAFALTLLASASCWYDSTWGQAKAAQKRYAAQATPGAIVPTDDARPGAPKRTYRVRLRPDAHYLGQTVDAERQLDALVDDADRVLGASLGLHLEVQKTEPWSLDADESLEVALAALRRDAAGDDVDVVVGLIGALPRPTDSFHEVGRAEVLGKHMQYPLSKEPNSTNFASRLAPTARPACHRRSALDAIVPYPDVRSKHASQIVERQIERTIDEPPHA